MKTQREIEMEILSQPAKATPQSPTPTPAIKLNGMDYCTQTHEPTWKLSKMDIGAFKAQLKRDGFLDEAIDQIVNAITMQDELISLLKDVLESEYIDHTGTLTPVLHAGDLRGMIVKAIAKVDGK